MRFKNITLSGWGRALSATMDVARPERQAGLKALCADQPAMGNRRSYGDPALNEGGKMVDMTKLDRVLSFDKEAGEIEVEAGLTIGDLARITSAHGWLPTVMPGTGFATIGGCIAMDVHGKNHHHVGSFGQHIAEITLIQDAKTRKITPKDKTIFRATIGGLGQTGIIASARLKLAKVNGDVMTVTERRVEGWDEHIALLDASQANYTVGWLDAQATGDAMGRGILEEAEMVYGLVPAPEKSKSVPFSAPRWAMSKPIVKAFNSFRFSRIPTTGRTVVKPFEDLFFPLDNVYDWNRLYGKEGFHQFQCIVPLAAGDVLKTIMQMIADSGLASPLAVLKRMGDGRGGMMSFPMEGYNLAVDFQSKPAAIKLIQKLETMIQEAGGRLYLAKDSLASGKQIKAMYPEYGAWSKAVEAADPKQKLATNMTRRLALRSKS